MGYTHYWKFGSDIDQKKYARALTKCRKIIKNSPVKLGNCEGKNNPVLTNGFCINGFGDEAHETFGMGKEPDRGLYGGDFCKTACKPYDVIVVACLCVLGQDLGKQISVSSDGDLQDWVEGQALASKVLGKPVTIPKAVSNG